ncbi:hypothetical protein [Streptomyces scabiei]|uniref:hypothetical protein n=1 Tax=Streptomyces scabiei TaxID=1930 RepID=UPI0029B0126E|nr:hypothetical protein [Streptomyces scabiei]MDX3520762.1 hypothetical protein [Streptomyces scabiei]
MGLKNTTSLAYGFEIPATTDFEALDAVLNDQPDSDRLARVQHLYLGDFEHLFLLTACEEIEANTFARLAPDDLDRHMQPIWETALHNMAIRLGHPDHPEPAWLVLHDHS